MLEPLKQNQLFYGRLANYISSYRTRGSAISWWTCNLLLADWRECFNIQPSGERDRPL